MKLVHILALAAVFAAPAAVAQDPWQDELRKAVEALRYATRSEAALPGIAAPAFVAELYERRDFKPAWRDNGKVAELLGAIRDAGAHGLTPRDYHLQRIEAAREGDFERLQASPARWAAFELLLSDALAGLVHHLRYGKTDPRSHETSWNFRDLDHPLETVDIAGRALAAPALRTFLAEEFGRNAWYRRLQATLAAYRRIGDAGGWEPLAGGASAIRPGTKDARIPALAERLAVSGDLGDAGSYANRDAMDATLEAAIRRFQARHGLAADGIVGSATLAALNRPVEERILQLRLALERARWVLDGVADDFVAVNIAGFRAFVVAGRRLVWETRVVVGRDQRQTPLFRDQLQYIVFNPGWTVPYSIATRDLLPQIKADPDWFASRDFSVRAQNGETVDPASVDWQSLTRGNFPYVLSQAPGPMNALGQVKFMFPNEYAVYLHDTPSRELFAAAERAFSSGCIRVEKPLELAEILLRANGWDRSRIDAAVASGRTMTVHLAERRPILLLYLTANVDPDGSVHFYRDIYDRDRRVAAALDGPWRIP